MIVLGLTKTDNKAFSVKPADLVYLNLTIKTYNTFSVVRVQYNIPTYIQFVLSVICVALYLKGRTNVRFKGTLLYHSLFFLRLCLE